MKKMTHFGFTKGKIISEGEKGTGYFSSFFPSLSHNSFFAVGFSIDMQGQVSYTPVRLMRVLVNFDCLRRGAWHEKK